MTGCKDIALSKNGCFTCLFLVILLELLPGSLQTIERQKRQVVFPGYDSAATCVTPDRRSGTCISLTTCPSLRGINNFNRLRRFFCGFIGEEPQVCCPTQMVTIRPVTTRPVTPRPVTSRPVTPRPVTPRPVTPRPVTPRPVTPRPATPSSGNGRPNSFGANGAAQGCGYSRYPKTRVVGGKEAEKGSWPWMVMIYKNRGGSRVPDCGGSLVTNQHVITAAHCVVTPYTATPLPARQLSVRLGEHDLYSSDDDMQPVDVNVESFVRHENFSPITYENDIAVLKLAQPVQFTINISTICLPNNFFSNSDLTGRRTFIAGWGATAYNGPSSGVLREASFEVQSQQYCRDVFREEVEITDVYICAGTLDASKDACQGDSGGPLMSIDPEDRRFYLIGIVSFGRYCATEGYPGVYTRVSEYLDWLRPLLSS